MSPTIDELFKRYQQKVPDATEVDFLDEVSRYHWNGWGRTIQEAAEKVVKEALFGHKVEVSDECHD